MLPDDHIYWMRMRRFVEEQITTEMNIVSSGYCSSVEDYKRRTGRIAAFREVLAQDVALRRELNSDDLIED